MWRLLSGRWTRPPRTLCQLCWCVDCSLVSYTGITIVGVYPPAWIRWINPVWINVLKSAGVRALDSLHHLTTLVRWRGTYRQYTDSPPAGRLAAHRPRSFLISLRRYDTAHHYSPSYWSLSFLTHPLRLWYVSGCVTLSVSLGPQHRWFSGCESHTMRVDCCHLCVHHAFWLDVVCLSVYHKRPALALRPTVNRINGLGGCQRFSQLTVHSTAL